MEPKFQTSFIPKKPIAGLAGGGIAPMAQKSPHHVASLFMVIAVFAFVASIAGVGGAYAWKSYLKTSQDNLKKDLADRERQFNIDRIEQLKQVNVQIDTAISLLRTHAAVSTIFDTISQLTAVNTRFMSLDVSGPTQPGGDIKIGLTGIGTNLMAVAFQSDVLATLERYGLRKAVKNPILFDPSIGTAGVVSFGMEASIDPESVSYEKLISGPEATSTTSTP